MHSAVSYISRKKAKNGRDLQWEWRFGFRERTSYFSLNFRQIDRRNLPGQEGKLFYAVRATRRYQFIGVLTNSVR